MTAWWDKIAGAADEDRDELTPTEAQHRSVYESRDMLDAAAPPAPDRELPTHTVNVMGHLVEVPACCANPALCEREGCWTPLAPSLDGFSGVR